MSHVGTPPPDPFAVVMKDLADRAEREQRGFDARLHRLEQGLPPIAGVPTSMGFPWDKIPDWIQAIAAVATPLMVILVGEWLTGSLDRAIKQQEAAIQQQQADFSGVKEMRSALVDLYDNEPKKTAVDSAALTIAAFGGVAAPPLIEAYNRGGAALAEAAKRGLIAASTHDKTRVCAVLASVSASTDQLYKPETIKFAADLQQALKC